MPFVNQRWLGGTLTNFRTIRSRIDYMLKLEERQAIGELEKLPGRSCNHKAMQRVGRRWLAPGVGGFTRGRIQPVIPLGFIGKSERILAKNKRAGRTDWFRAGAAPQEQRQPEPGELPR